MSEDLEALERAVAEIEVIESIYGGSDETNEQEEDAFRVVSQDALEAARHLVASGSHDSTTSTDPPRLDIILKLPLLATEGNVAITAVLRCGLPPGYPISRAAIISVEVPTLTRAVQDRLSQELNKYSAEQVGEEAILAIAQKFQEIGVDALEVASKQVDASSKEENQQSTAQSSNPLSFSRQWLFMDHIKAESRRAQMIREATSLNVGGLIKPGYPGVCVVEGQSDQVEDFVSWMKQIWIGRVAVRGQVSIPLIVEEEEARKLPRVLTDLGDGKNLPNMGVLGSACRKAGLEEEFLEYIMQIRPSS